MINSIELIKMHLQSNEPIVDYSNDLIGPGLKVKCINKHLRSQDPGIVLCKSLLDQDERPIFSSIIDLKDCFLGLELANLHSSVMNLIQEISPDINLITNDLYIKLQKEIKSSLEKNFFGEVTKGFYSENVYDYFGLDLNNLSDIRLIIWQSIKLINKEITSK